MSGYADGKVGVVSVAGGCGFGSGDGGSCLLYRLNLMLLQWLILLMANWHRLGVVEAVVVMVVLMVVVVVVVVVSYGEMDDELVWVNLC